MAPRLRPLLHSLHVRSTGGATGSCWRERPESLREEDDDDDDEEASSVWARGNVMTTIQSATQIHAVRAQSVAVSVDRSRFEKLKPLAPDVSQSGRITEEVLLLLPLSLLSTKTAVMQSAES